LPLSALVFVIFVGGMFVLGFGFGFVDSGVVERRGNGGGRQIVVYPSILSITLGSRNENRRLVLSSASLYK
jgi:hypothetical protein